MNRHSVISQGHYEGLKKPEETIAKIMDGRKPKLLMDIHSISDVNKVELGALPGPATSNTFNNTGSEEKA